MDKLTDLRSRAMMPQGSVAQQELDEWFGKVNGLSQAEFEALLEPFLLDNRRTLLLLPEWSRTVLVARWVAPRAA